MTDALARTPLFAWHAAHGGRMVDFAGWSMPVQYTSIVEEHLACRKAAALFDVSHMGRLLFRGRDVGKVLDFLLTRRVADMAAWQIRYGFVTNHEAGILDDILCYRFPDEEGKAPYGMVVNASNRAKIIDWIRVETPPGSDFAMEDHTAETAMIAVQGPKGLALAEKVLGVKLAHLKYYTAQPITWNRQPGLASRTGYTGEDGCELIVDANGAAELWEKLLAAGKDEGVIAAGLGARDTLRLEAALPLYGHELGEEINPVQTGIKFAVNMENRQFIGRDAMLIFKQDPNQTRLIGITLEGRRVPRQGFKISHGGQIVGEVMSGTFSPSLDKPIALAYVLPTAAEPGTQVDVDIRGTATPAVVVKPPFVAKSTK